MPLSNNLVSLLALVAASASSAAAMPRPGSGLSARQHETDCPGQQYYTCANGYEGCFDQDPCAWPPITSSSSSSTTSATTMATSTTTSSTRTSTTSTSTATPTQTGETCRKRSKRPVLYNTYPQEPSRAAGPAAPGLHVESYRGLSQLEQVAHFTLPASAKTCYLMWEQSSRSTRVFLVDGPAGQMMARPLSGKPTGGDGGDMESVTWDMVRAVDDASREESASPDFTFWDETEEATKHTADAIGCARDLYVKFAAIEPKEQSHVYMQQDEGNGLYIEWEEEC